MSMKFKRADIVAYEDGIAVIAIVPPRVAPYSTIGLNWMIPPSRGNPLVLEPSPL